MKAKKFYVLSLALILSGLLYFAIGQKTPAIVYLKDGGSIEIKHFGQLKCGNKMYMSNFVMIKGKYLDTVTEIKEYHDIEKIVFEGFTKAPIASVGNEKATVRVFKKNGVSVALDDAEVTLSCYGPGDKYNEIIVQIYNPLEEKNVEKKIATKDIQSVVFK